MSEVLTTQVVENVANSQFSQFHWTVGVVPNEDRFWINVTSHNTRLYVSFPYTRDFKIKLLEKLNDMNSVMERLS
jgi:hypothetical protein